MKINANDLDGLALDWAVTMAERPDELRYGLDDWREQRRSRVVSGEYDFRWHQSWNQAGAVIDREQINLTTIHDSPGLWGAFYDDGQDHTFPHHGETPLLAAMRCFVAQKLGQTIDVPDELLSKTIDVERPRG